jgi:DNA repair exonuclease SbcCD nuclease subunit
MPFEPLRFLHAANIRLDHAIGETYKLPPRVASIVQDATRAAFERLIGVALDRRVDFLLLAGNTFIEAEHSLAARLALLEGLEQLAQESIRVFVLPGFLDPVEAWRQIPDLPRNVTILDSESKTPLVFKRDGKSIARIATSPRLPQRKGPRAMQRELRSESQRPVPFTIGVLATNGDDADARALETWSAGQETSHALIAESEPVAGWPRDEILDSPVDYLAFGGGRARRTFAKRKGIAHDTGALQGGGPRETGPRGGTLVTVESDGTVQCDFIPAASARWERFSIPVDVSTSRRELLQRCRGFWEETRGESSENAWIFEWVLRGSVAALDPFDEASCRQLGQELNETAIVPSVEAAVHTFVLQTDPDALEVCHGEDPLQADFAEALADRRRGLPAVFALSLSELATVDQEWATRLETLVSELEPDAISAQAHRILRKLFRTAGAEGASAP